jgi:hypothetical protein
MDTFRFFRIGLLIALIFATGVVTGRFTVPPGTAPATAPTTIETTDRHGQKVTPRTVLRDLDAALRLGPAQEQRLLPDIEAMLNELANAPVASNERFEIVRKYRPKLREILRPEQIPAFEKLVERQEQRMKELQANSPK